MVEYHNYEAAFAYDDDDDDDDETLLDYNNDQDRLWFRPNSQDPKQDEITTNTTLFREGIQVHVLWDYLMENNKNYQNCNNNSSSSSNNNNQAADKQPSHWIVVPADGDGDDDTATTLADEDMTWTQDDTDDDDDEDENDNLDDAIVVVDPLDCKTTNQKKILYSQQRIGEESLLLFNSLQQGTTNHWTKPWMRWRSTSALLLAMNEVTGTTARNLFGSRHTHLNMHMHTHKTKHRLLVQVKH